MLGFISIGNYSLREEALWSSPTVMAKLLWLTKQVAQETGLPLSGLLTSQDFLATGPENLCLPQQCIPEGNRLHKEVETLLALAGEKLFPPNQWLVILRPGEGWINRNRVIHFLESLPQIDGGLAVSVKKISTLANPSWNVHVSKTSFTNGASLMFQQMNRLNFSPLRDAFPELWNAIGCETMPCRSQDLDTFYIDDGVMYAFRTEPTHLTATNLLIPDAVPVYFEENDYMQTPLYEKLPIFDVNKGCYLDIGIIEKILP